MDPATVVGLVAACSSLATKCLSCVKTLDSLAQTYKYAEITILSFREECETIQLAWHQLEEWARSHLHKLEHYDQILERLQRSIYAGQLIMDALAEDLSTAIPKTGTFRRRANLTWNETQFQAHQNRIRGQVIALQLLLQVVSMTRDEERADTLTIKEYVFRDVDDSVRSIVPSRMSSRFSVTDSERASVRSSLSTPLKYIKFGFENDLFTSFVYKRNYRFPFFDPSPVSTGNDNTPLRGGPENDNATIVPSPNSRRLSRQNIDGVSGTVGQPNDVMQSGVTSLPVSHGRPISDVPNTGAMTYREFDSDIKPRPSSVHSFHRRSSWTSMQDIVTNPMPLFYPCIRAFRLGFLNGSISGAEPTVARALVLLANNDDHALLDLVRSSLDIAVLFCRCDMNNPEALLRFICVASVEDPHFMETALQRVALSTGTVFFRFLDTAFMTYASRHAPEALKIWDKIRPAVEITAKEYDIVADLSSGTSIFTTLLHLACFFGHHSVVEKLLDWGFLPDRMMAHLHPSFIALVRKDQRMLEILNSKAPLADDLHAAAIWGLLSHTKSKFFLWIGRHDDLPTVQPWTAIFSDILGLIEHESLLSMAKGKAQLLMVNYWGTMMPIVHAIIYWGQYSYDSALQTRCKSGFEILVQRRRWCGDLDTVCVVAKPWQSQPFSPLAFAAVLGAIEEFEILLKYGAKVFEAHDNAFADVRMRQDYGIHGCLDMSRYLAMANMYRNKCPQRWKSPEVQARFRELEATIPESTLAHAASSTDSSVRPDSPRPESFRGLAVP